jgi:hypothetical protein
VILKAAFAGVPKMLIGKNYPMNVRALRLVVEELLRDFLPDIECSDDLDNFLDKVSTESLTSKHWVDNLIKRVFLMMLFVRAEREGDWALHLHAVSEMIPYFFAAGHHHYARYDLYYLRDMERLPNEVQVRFEKGEHVLRHQDGLWNGIWSDMFIETTFMRYGKGPGGLIGVTLNPRSIKKWANSLHTCTGLLKDLDDMRERDLTKSKIKHKEEMPSRIKADEIDREKLRTFIKNCINPLDPSKHPKISL